MTVYKTAYDTTVCHMFDMSKVVDAIKVAQVRDYPANRDGVVFIESTENSFAAIGEWKHPIYIGKGDLHNNAGRVGADWAVEPLLAVNLRTACRKDPHNPYGFKVVNSTGYRVQAYRAALNALWLENGGNAFRGIYPVTLAIYAQWIANALAFRYNLDYATKVKLLILAGIWYASNHVDGQEFARNDEDRQIAAITNALKLTAIKGADVYAAYDSVKMINSIDEFCTKTKAYTGDVRLEDLNPGTMIAIIGGTWPVDNGIELAGVALEHPPTWLAMLYETTVNLAMRKTGLARLCEDKHYAEGLGKIKNIVQAHASNIVEMVDNRIAESR
jgi:hypothetical protein